MIYTPAAGGPYEEIAALANTSCTLLAAIACEISLVDLIRVLFMKKMRRGTMLVVGFAPGKYEGNVKAMRAI